MYVLLKREDTRAVIISKNNHDYNDLVMLGYQELFAGTKKDCMEVLDEIENNII
jgi:hypothetical protein